MTPLLRTHCLRWLASLALAAVLNSARASDISVADYRDGLERMRTALDAGRLSDAQSAAKKLDGKTVSDGIAKYTPDPSIVKSIRDAKQLDDVKALTPRIQKLAAALAQNAESERRDSAPNTELLAALRHDEEIELPPRDGEISDGGIADSGIVTTILHYFADAIKWAYEKIRDFFKWFESLFPTPKAGLGDGVGPVIKYILIGCACVVAAFIIRAFLKNRRFKKVRTDFAPVSAPALAKDADPLSRDAGAWEEYAARLSAQGRHREAVRAWYHAVLTTLFRAGMLTFRKGRTNWEYYYTLPQDFAARPEFENLTGFFEVEWYGKVASEPADAARYGDAVRQFFVARARRESRMIFWLRKLPLIAALLGVVGAFIWLDSDKEFKREIFPAHSLHNISGKGVSLAFRYLTQTRGPNAPAVSELHRMIDFADLEPSAVVFRIAPEFKPGEHKEDDPNKSGKGSKAGAKKAPVAPIPGTPKPVSDDPLLTQGEFNFVKKGGRLVLALDANYGPIGVDSVFNEGHFKKTFDLNPGVNIFRPKPNRTLSFKNAMIDKAKSIPAPDNVIALFTIDSGIFAARVTFDDALGEVILIASPEIFTNNHLDQSDNLKLLTALAPSDRRIYFDEFVHGLRGTPGMIEMLIRWGMGMALVVLALGSVIAFWRARTPIGTPEDDHKETRTQAIDFVNSLAPLYNRALDPHQAIALHYKNFIQTVSATSGLRGAELRAKILSLLGTSDETGLSGQRPLSSAEFHELLRTLNEAFGRLERAHRR